MSTADNIQRILHTLLSYMTEELVAEINIPLSLSPLRILTLVIKYDRRSILLDTLILIWACFMWTLLVT